MILYPKFKIRKIEYPSPLILYLITGSLIGNWEQGAGSWELSTPHPLIIPKFKTQNPNEIQTICQQFGF
jgi:hypothetical protein